MALKSGALRGGLRNAFFAPNDIASLAHWYDATEISGSDGDAIGTWVDQEGTDDLTQGTSSKKPTLKTGIENSKVILRFDSDDFMNVDYTDISQGLTVFAVASKSTASGTSGGLFDGFSNTVTFLWSSGSSAWFMNAGTDVGGGSHTQDFTQWTVEFDGANSLFRQDQSQVASGNAGSNTQDGLTAGARTGGGTNWNGDIGELHVYDSILSSTDRSDVESYLKDKWATP